MKTNQNQKTQICKAMSHPNNHQSKVNKADKQPIKANKANKAAKKNKAKNQNLKKTMVKVT